MAIRAFIALRLSDEFVDGCLDVQRQVEHLKAHGWRFMPRENLHLTLLFSAQVEREAAIAGFEWVKYDATKIPAPLLTPYAVGGPTKVSRSRVLCIRLQGDQPLNDLRFHAQRSGISESDRKHFHPHITIARHKESVDLRKIEGIESVMLPSPYKATHFELIQSNLGPAGSTYTTLDSVELLQS